ncbi:MAG TPA: gluconokinase [bacterium]|nr:gluconokinase [bacterium]
MIYIVMGVLASGKTTIGSLLAEKLGYEFHDADDFHPPSNREKMGRGEALTDADRKPWIAAVRAVIEGMAAAGTDAVIACSALREDYRKTLSKGRKDVVFIYIKGDYGMIKERAERRKGHFVDPALLKSQFETLEEPDNAVVVDAKKSSEEAVRDIIGELKNEGETR